MSDGTSHVYLAQLKCPNDHCAVALAGAYESDEEAKVLADFVVEQFERAAALGIVNRICALCGSTKFHVDLGRTIWRTMDEATPLLHEAEYAQIISAQQIKAGEELMGRTAEQLIAAILNRRHGDGVGDAAAAAEVRRVNDAWREQNPLAAAEPASEPFEPLRLLHVRTPDDPPQEPDEIWVNGKYSVTLRRKKPDPVFGTKLMIALGVNSEDGTARHDWRDLQAIKNQLAGPECEAFELFPAESRLVDPSNYYLLWCFPHMNRIKVGLTDGRRVWDADEAMAPQRGMPK